MRLFKQRAKVFLMDVLSGVGLTAAWSAVLCCVIWAGAAVLALVIVLRGTSPPQRPSLLRALAGLVWAFRSTTTPRGGTPANRVESTRPTVGDPDGPDSA